MAHDSNEVRIIREKLEALRVLVERGYPSDFGGTGDAAAFVGETKAIDAYPTDASAFYALSPVEVGGSEEEGDEAEFTADFSQTIYAANVGPSVPPVGTRVLVRQVGDFWTFFYG